MPTWPTSKPNSNLFDNDSDSIKASRPELKTMSDAVNDIVDFVDTTGIQNNDVLKYNSTSQRLEPGQAGIDNPLLIGNQTDTDSAGATLGKIEFVGTDSAANSTLTLGFDNTNSNAGQIVIRGDAGVNSAEIELQVQYASGTNIFQFGSSEVELGGPSFPGGGVTTVVNRLRVEGPGSSGNTNFPIPSITTFNKDLYIGPLSGVDIMPPSGQPFDSAGKMEQPAIFFDENAGSIYISVRNLQDSAGGVGDLYLNYLKWPTVDGTSGQVLQTDGTGNLSWVSAAGGGTMNNLIDDTSPQLGGSLDINGFQIVSAAGDIALTPGGSGYVNIDGLRWPNADGTYGQAILTDGAGNLSFGNVIRDITAGSGITITSDSAGAILISANTGDSIQAGTNISITSPDSAGGKSIGLLDPLNAQVDAGDQIIKRPILQDYAETVNTIGSGGSTVTPDQINGNIQKLTLTTTPVTMNLPVNMPTGGSMTLILRQDGGGSKVVNFNASYKFAGGTKTLSTAPNAIDVVSVFYDGTDYIASLSTNFS
jgi:hypothetical protein